MSVQTAITVLVSLLLAGEEPLRTLGRTVRLNDAKDSVAAARTVEVAAALDLKATVLVMQTEGAGAGTNGTAKRGGDAPGAPAGAQSWAKGPLDDAALTLCSFLGMLAFGHLFPRYLPGAASAVGLQQRNGAVKSMAPGMAQNALSCAQPLRDGPSQATQASEAATPAATPPPEPAPDRTGGTPPGRAAAGGSRAHGTSVRGPAAGSGMEGTNALAEAVRGGRAAELPRLLDEAWESLQSGTLAAGRVTVAEMQQLLSALRACASRHCFSEALAAYDHVAGRVGDGCSGIWSLLLYSAVAASQFHRCEAFWENLCKCTDPCGHDFLNMVQYFIHGRNLSGLEQMLRGLVDRGVQVGGLSWNRALAACMSARMLELAEALVASGTRLGGMDAVAYNTLMRGYARIRDAERCFKCYQDMRAQGVGPSEVTFGVLLEACHEARDFGRAEAVFGDLRRCGLRPNVVHCTAFMKCLVGAGRLEDAEEVLRWMQQSQDTAPDLMAYSMLVKAQAELGNVQRALQVLQDMLDHGIQPDAVALNTALTGCYSAKLAPKQTFRVLRWLLDRGLQPSTTTLSILIKALAASQAWGWALKVLQQAPEKLGVWPEERLYIQLAQGCAKMREGGWVLEVYAAMLEVAALQHVPVGRTASSRLLELGSSCGEATATTARRIHRLVEEVRYCPQPGCVRTLMGSAT